MLPRSLILLYMRSFKVLFPVEQMEYLMKQESDIYLLDYNANCDGAFCMVGRKYAATSENRRSMDYNVI